MNIYSEFLEKMKQDDFNKYAVIDVLNLYVNGKRFFERLEDFAKKNGERREYHGVIYSEEYEKDDEGYFGENKILFYSGDYADEEDNPEDIVEYDEFYKYLEVACEFFLERNPSQKEKVEELILEIKKTYGI
ncbi:ribonuclease toxin immunity protein CdiI [Clostridium sp. SHJSY1]|uniref:ribonuclease toxin immunity protein CdiI n=1 Tax=Clostridium sp. SHJSY1 TaxID=2942483 RepID=UPI0028756435|nr:ribonuclease toxin immunity protein CdiI [Clostridium sp. SHJSY1]MDS0528096.1 ribonuclease toxin immunity protein CdiI [Clostridium sp. SHJSY1]